MFRQNFYYVAPGANGDMLALVEPDFPAKFNDPYRRYAPRFAAEETVSRRPGSSEARLGCGKSEC